MKSKKKKDTISKDNFIEYLSSCSPAEINKMIEEKGKPLRKICPIFFFPPKDE